MEVTPKFAKLYNASSDEVRKKLMGLMDTFEKQFNQEQNTLYNLVHVMTLMDRVITNEIPKHLHCCEEGCSHCCYQNVDCTKKEAELILGYCHANQIEVDFKACERLSKLSDTFGQPCPFLKNNRCSVYEVRPLYCRSHYAVSNPELCRTDVRGVQAYRFSWTAEVILSVVGRKHSCLPLWTWIDQANQTGNHYASEEYAELILKVGFQS